MHDPSLAAFDTGLNILAYLLSAKDIGLTYTKSEPNITAYSDASWNQVPIPFGGHVVLYGGAAVSFSARKVKTVPQSSAEAETAAHAKSTKDIRYVTNIVGPDGFQLKLSLPVTINCNNQAAVSSIKNTGSTARNRHYERWLQFGREQYVPEPHLDPSLDQHHAHGCRHLHKASRSDQLPEVLRDPAELRPWQECPNFLVFSN